MTDFIIDNQRSVFAVIPVSDEAKAWIDEHVADDAHWLGKALVVEHRFIDGLIDGFSGDSLSFEAA